MLNNNTPPLIFEGTIKSFANNTYILADNDESFMSWIHQNAEHLEGRRVKIIIRNIDLIPAVSLHKIHYTT